MCETDIFSKETAVVYCSCLHVETCQFTMNYGAVCLGTDLFQGGFFPLSLSELEVKIKLLRSQTINIKGKMCLP